MSGTGKSTIIAELADRGYKAIDTDWNPDWEQPTDSGEWLWREDRIRALLDSDDAGALFVSACVSNQGKFYDLFDAVVLLSAPEPLILQRLEKRTNNPYGKRADEVAEVLHNKKTIEPLLRRGATVEIDTSVPVTEVVARVLAAADPPALA